MRGSVQRGGATEVLVGHVPQDAYLLDALMPQPCTLGNWKSPDGASHCMSPPGPASHLGTTSVPKEQPSHHLHPGVWSAPCHPPCQEPTILQVWPPKLSSLAILHQLQLQ